MQYSFYSRGTILSPVTHPLFSSKDPLTGARSENVSEKSASSMCRKSENFQNLSNKQVVCFKLSNWTFSEKITLNLEWQ